MRRGSTILPGFIFPSGSQIALNSREGAAELRPEHLAEELRARLAVAVLAGERSADAHHQVRRLLHERAELADPGARRRGRSRSRQWTQPMPEVSVDRGVVAELEEQLAERAQVLAHPLGRDGRVFPPRPGIGLAGHERRRSEARLADVPEVPLLDRVGDHARARGHVGSLEAREEAAGLVLRLLAVSPPSSTNR